MIKVKDLKKDIFPFSFLSFLPEECEYCGADNEVIETLSSLQCSNPNCISKVGYRLFSLLKDIGLNILTVDDCMAYLMKCKSSNPYKIFLYNPDKDGIFLDNWDMDKSKSLYEEINKRRNMILWEFVKIGNFEYLNYSVKKLLMNYDNLNDFYNDLGKEGIPFIQKLLLENTEYQDIKNKICVDAVLIYESFIAHKEELKEGMQGVNFIYPDIKLSILFANNASDYECNQLFLNEINDKLKGHIYLTPSYIIDNDIDLVYWEDLNVTVSNSIIEKVKNDFPKIKIVNSENILNVILEVLSNG